MQEKLPLWRRSIKAVLLTLLTIVLLTAFYLAVVMGNPQDPPVPAAKQDQPLLSAMEAPVIISMAEQLDQILQSFPAPVMAASNPSVAALESGICQDVPFENGLGRMVTLSYRTADGAVLTVTSIYPARATSLIAKGDYTISSTAGLPLAGLRSVRMEAPGSICMHAQGDAALYAVTLPERSGMALRTLTATLQLYQGD